MVNLELIRLVILTSNKIQNVNSQLTMEWFRTLIIMKKTMVSK